MMKRENRDGALPTAVDCYMKDKGVSKQEAICEFVEIVENAWKDVTADWAKGSSSVPKEMVEMLLNYGRIAEITYHNKEDGYTNPEKYLGPLIASLFVDPLHIWLLQSHIHLGLMKGIWVKEFLKLHAIFYGVLSHVN